MKINLFQALRAISRATDLVNPRLSSHHERTAYITYAISGYTHLSGESIRRAFIAALIHDIGGITEHHRIAPLSYENKTDISHHSLKGGDLLSEVGFLPGIADIVRFHHTEWAYGAAVAQGKATIPDESHLVFLADRIDTLLAAHGEEDFLSASRLIRSRIIQDAGRRFAPELVDAFLKVSANASFWLNLEGGLAVKSLENDSPLADESISLTEFMALSKILASIIDAHSHFTAEHSRRVGKLARQVAIEAGLNDVTALKLEIAGYLHDIGKLAVPAKILNKKGALTEAEFLKIKRHSFTTGLILSDIAGLEDITAWAENHHERANGSGYPYGRLLSDLRPQGQIVALSDVYVALTENRPYRKGMGRQKALDIVEAEFKYERTPFVDALITATL